MSSDFMRTLSSIPNERGFKMAFLNIVSLPKKIDEINFSMSKKFIDLIAFNETRLDANITDNMINLDGYDIVRKDRSRNGGGVCIYLRSSINYKIRDDLVPSELEAVCVEIIKPHRKPFLISDSGVIHTGISDHSLIFAIRKISVIKKQENKYSRDEKHEKF